jgi:hypothetical protein
MYIMVLYDSVTRELDRRACIHWSNEVFHVVMWRASLLIRIIISTDGIFCTGTKEHGGGLGV